MGGGKEARLSVRFSGVRRKASALARNICGISEEERRMSPQENSLSASRVGSGLDVDTFQSLQTKGRREAVLPLVSAVITTCRRPVLVCRALNSVLNQTYPKMEVVVVVDGPEPYTAEILKSFQDPRLRVIELPVNVGLSGARNAGVLEARGEWVSFLDDDDEWMPDKINKQVGVLAHSDPDTNFVACRSEARGAQYTKIIPSRFPGRQEEWSEYIFRAAEDMLITYLVKRDLVLAVPYTMGLKYNEDSDWLLRARASKGLHPAWLYEPLYIYHCETDLERICNLPPEWDVPYRWAIQNRNVLMTRKAFSYCLLRLCLPQATRSRKPVRNTLSLLHKAISLGNIDVRFCCKFPLACAARFKLYHQLRAACREVWERIASSVRGGRQEVSMVSNSKR
jgi:glycosyltransferase involved in cell wall biosynthesis